MHFAANSRLIDFYIKRLRSFLNIVSICQPNKCSIAAIRLSMLFILTGVLFGFSFLSFFPWDVLCAFSLCFLQNCGKWLVAFASSTYYLPPTTCSFRYNPASRICTGDLSVTAHRHNKAAGFLEPTAERSSY